ncbi:MAG: hypothetical protein KDD66_03850 [Bdellovibrionales bacterium]|nr:hypothetical protein [Bdellovibrionales bacterium]
MIKRKILLISMLLMTGCSKEILHDVSEARANSVILALSQMGIDAAKERDASGWTIKVAQTDASRALDALQRARILGEKKSEAEVPETGFILSREERTHFMERSLAQNLESTLERLPGVLEARVHIYLAAGQSLSWSPKDTKRSASALLVVALGTSINESQVRALVSGAAGMSADEVAVVVSQSELALASDPAAEKILAVSSVFGTAPTSLLLLGVLSLIAFLTLLRRVLAKSATPDQRGWQQLDKIRPAVQPAVSQKADGEVF